MNALIDVTLRSSMVLLAGLVVRALLRKRSAAFRHLVLAVSLAAAAAVGPLSLVMPSWSVSIRAPRTSTAQPKAGLLAGPTRAVPVEAVKPAGPRQVAPGPIWLRVWLSGFFVTALALTAGMLRINRIASRARVLHDSRWLTAVTTVARHFHLRRNVVLLQTDAPDLLATWGVLRPCVLLPSHAREWSDERIHLVLCHELAHVRRLDWGIQTSADVLRALLWFNPLVWIVCTYLRRESELACDDLVLGRGVSSHDYATHLLDLARKCRRPPSLPLPVVQMARRSTLERRIADMLNPRIDRHLSTRSVGVVSVLLVAVTAATAALRAAQTGPATLGGTVYDTTGAVMPGVTLALEDVTQMKYEAQTDAAGRFGFANVQPGHYTLNASLPGFRSLRQEFDLNARRDWDRAITLQVGDLRETITVRERRTTSAASSPPKPAQPVRVGGSIRAPLKTLDVRPTYPASMRDAGREGVVPIEAIIGQDGTVTSVRVLSAQVHPDFAIAAVDAVRQWRFTPTLLNGSPVEVVMTVSVAFTLSEQ